MFRRQPDPEPGSVEELDRIKLSISRSCYRRDEFTSFFRREFPDPKLDFESKLSTVDKDYFSGYADYKIHQRMIKDLVRTESYRDAILDHPHNFEGKIVMDVGCGTGILSMFAAKAGALMVIGVDSSDIAYTAREVVRANGLDDRVFIIKSRVEDITELPFLLDGVDVIVSEWMGISLFDESMLETVLYARDKWLVKNGKIFPDKFSLYITATEGQGEVEERHQFWDDVSGFEMSCLKDAYRMKAVVEAVDRNKLVTDSCRLVDLDLNTATKEEQKFLVPFHLHAKRSDYIHAFATFFTAEFTRASPKNWFSTGPEAASTHWRQTLFYLKTPLPIKRGEIIRGFISMQPNEYCLRALDCKRAVEGKIGKFHEISRYFC